MITQNADKIEAINKKEAGSYEAKSIVISPAAIDISPFSA